MLIEEQIKIARLIASGTPREVAINEVAPTSSIEKSGETIDLPKSQYQVIQDKSSCSQGQLAMVCQIQVCGFCGG